MTRNTGSGYVIRNRHNGKFAVYVLASNFHNKAHLNFTRNIDSASVFREDEPSKFAIQNGIHISSLKDCEFIAATAYRYVSLD